MESRFDVLAKALASSGSRRDALRRIAGITSAAVLASFGYGCGSDAVTGPQTMGRYVPSFARGRCKKVGQKCRENDECCSDFCDPFSGYCSCPSGSVVCPGSGQCVPACSPPFVLNPDTCQCECPANSFACGGVTCCVTGTDCCGNICTNLQTDVQNCGSCGTACTAANATNACVAGTCQFTCNPGFGDCDGNPANGCETFLNNNVNNCGACGVVCPAVAGGFRTCTNGVCGFVCQFPFANCDNNPNNGCETNVLSNPNHCGACNNQCPAGAICQNGVCCVLVLGICVPV